MVVVAGKLDTYNKKRRFSETPEPSGSDEAPASDAPRFVVQEHHARRLHWDFRLERGGVLVSWALPRGFPDDPAEDLPAARTDDHSLGYIDFEGEIPAGSYGAGRVLVWDRGTYDCEAFDERRVVVRLHGQRLDARYALYGAGEEWRIHRVDPPDPGRARMPERVVPMLARLGKLPADVERYG